MTIEALAAEMREQFEYVRSEFDIVGQHLRRLNTKIDDTEHRLTAKIDDTEHRLTAKIDDALATIQMEISALSSQLD